MVVINSTIQIRTNGNAEIVDITDKSREEIQQSLVSDGLLTIFCPSSTSALTTIEFEPGCVKDLTRLLDEIVDSTREYAHNARWGDGNGHSHVRAALLGPSLSVPFINSTLTLGTWQQIIFIDFDNRSRERNLVVQIIGE